MFACLQLNKRLKGWEREREREKKKKNGCCCFCCCCYWWRCEL